MSATNLHIKKGVEQYHQQRSDNEIDLVNEVRLLLMNSGLGNKIANYDNHRLISEAKNKNSEVQRFLLNRYWHQQLVTTSVNTIDERYCLIPNGDVRDWLNLFKDKIMPCIIENNLPVAI